MAGQDQQNPVITAIDNGHVAKWVQIDKEDHPTLCRLDGEAWPCAVIVQARQEHAARRRRRGQVEVAR